jgi:hypothetical protein
MAKGIKTGGREKNTPNHLTSELRNFLKNVIAKELEKIPDTLENLPPKERLEMVIRLIPYVLPKVETVKPTSGEPFQLETW